MKTNRLYSLMMILLWMAIGVNAQEINKLYIPDVNVEAGKQFLLPVYVQNTSQKITGLQFTIAIPKGVIPDFNDIKLTERSENHKVRVHQDNNSQWTLMLYSTKNTTIRANAGIIFNIPTIVADSVKEGSVKVLGMEKVALSDSLGNNVLTEFSCGKINITKTPDFIVKDITCDLLTINPEDSINIEWKVKNIGGESSTGGWSEIVSLVSEAGDIKVLTTTYYNDGVLAGGAEISRKAGIQLGRALGLGGKGHIKIELRPNADSGERDVNMGNNITESEANGLTINKKLYVTMAERMNEQPLTETTLRLTVLRSGSWKSNEKVTITKQGDDRILLPENTTIPASSSENTFYLTVKEDYVLNDDSLFTITVAVDGYESVSRELIIIDDELPQLTVTATKKELLEGEKMTVTITNQRAPKSPLTINVNSNLPSRLKYPAAVIMEAGQTTTTFEVEALQDTEVTDTLTANLNISADRHYSDELLFFFVDDDMPELELVLKPTTVSEGDGPTSIIGKIIRNTKTENKVTIELSDDSNGQLYYGMRRMTLNEGEREAEFSMGAIDNAEVDGTRLYNVTAAVYISACGCSAKSSSVGSVSQQITVTDDDGPTLKVVSANSSIKEGGQSTLTITLNTNTDADVSVNLSSDYDDMLEYNHQLVIPAGKKSVEVAITAKKNELAEDNRVVVFTVEADGYAPGTCWVQITDQTIPDAMITNITVTPSELEVGQKVTVNVTIKNKGNADLPSLTRVNFYFRNNTKELGHAYTADALAIDGELTLNNELEMPDIPGNYTLYAVINEDRAINELTYSNNNSQDVAIRLLPAFTATVHTDKNLYSTSETVTFSGKATGTKAANSDVEVYFINEGNRQTITAKTDNEGNYSIEYPLPKTMSGHFIVGACYPNEKLQTEMATFDVYGLRLSACSNNCKFDLGDIYEGSMTITNAVNLKQTGLKVVQNGSSENSLFTFMLPETLEAGKNIKINFKITPSAVSADWQKMPITITSNEGSSTDYCIYYHVNSRLALLSSNVKSINTTMTKGEKRDYPITIKNVGKGETGKITLGNLPNWMKTSTPLEMTSLLQGDSATIVLQLIPTDDLALNIPIEGSISIICENASSLRIPCSITPVSESKGKLIVDIVDEFTFETNEAPHVSNAKIVVKHPTTGEVIAQGNSGEDGKFSMMLPEGQYEVTVNAENHEDYTNQIIVDAGVDNNHEAFISYEAVTYSWDVVETEIEDSYEIETIVKFDTRVPKPVILISLPEERPEDGAIIPIVVTNKGFINAEDVNVSLAISGNYNIEFLTEPYLAKLAANQSEVFYAKITSVNATRPGTRAPSLRECLSLQAKLLAHYICGNKYDNTVTADDLRRWGECLNYAGRVYSYGGWGYGGGGGYGGGDGYGGGGGWGGYDGGYGGGWWQIVPIPTRACSPGSWNNNPDYLEDPNDPIDLPKMNPQKEEPDEQNCDSKEELKLVYKIIPVEGTKYLLNGVAADGISQVKLVLDPDNSTVPPQDCDNFYDFEWRLSNEKYGKIEGDSYMEAIFTAPENFPVEYDRRIPKTEVEATLWYTQRIDDHTTYGRHSTPVKIEIIRPPVVFVHGLGDSDTCWYYLDKSLTDYRYYEHGINYRINYKNTNTSAFDANVYEIGRGLITARRRALNQGYIASKCDLVGHSMGGVLSRLYAQRGGDDEINRLITVNTPHSGSEFGDAVMGHPVVLGLLSRAKYWKMNIDAVRDLAVESDAIAQLNSGPKSEIPVYAIATQKNKAATLAAELGVGAGLDKIGGLCIKRGLAGGPIGLVVGLAAGISFKYFSHFVNDDLTQIGAGDLIVSTESQIGGCNSSMVIGDGSDGPWHCNSPKDSKVINALINLLTEDNNSPVFSRNWFNPSKRTFDHSLWQLQLGVDIAMDLSLNSKAFREATEGNDIESQNLKKLTKILEGELMILKAEEGYLNFDEASANSNATRRANTQDGDRCLSVELNEIPGFSDPIVSISYGDTDAAIAEGYKVELEVPSHFSGDANLTVFMKGTDGNVVYEDYIYTFDQPSVSPVSLEIEDVYLEKGDSVPIRLYCLWDDGQKTKVDPSNIIIENKDIAEYSKGVIIGLKKGHTLATVSYAGLICNTTIRVFDSEEDEYSGDNEPSNSVCSTITLSFKQEMVMTRQAFRGTLTVNNGDAANEMKDVKLNLEVKDEDGHIATSHEFQINAESLKEFEGEIDLAAGWKLKAKGTGVATILFIPTKYAAPTEPKAWSFGGSFSYTDPTTGLAVTKNLNPVTLTVKPSPNLAMDYFMQRNVLGDDALTEDIIEPMVPAEFSLLINNIGYGDATNVKMVTHQPEIIDNEKGLLIDFEILSSQLNGGEKTLALGQSVATDFGTIPAGKTSYAQWWFTSSLLGHFTDYDVKATHVTSYGNPDLTLLDTVIVHELIHTLNISSSETMRGFLVNDIEDTNDMPDKLYLTDGTTANVAQASATITENGNNRYTLTVNPSAGGWNYGSLVDPTAGKKTLASITRQSDGASIDLANFWQTDRTLRDGKDPLYEYRIHFADEITASSEVYLLTFEDKPMTILDVESFEGVSETTIITTPVEKVSVIFNKDVAASTFTTEDLELRLAGSKLDAEKIVISQVNEKQFNLDLKELTSGNGYYVLTVQAAGIKDTEGYSGEYGRQLTWTQLKDGKLEVKLDYAAQTGWNWISSSLADVDKQDVKTFLEPIKDKVVRLVGYETEMTNDPVYGFVGGLTTLNPAEGYKLHVNELAEFSYTGEASNTATTRINLQKGWNWIGYLPVIPLSLETALAGFTPDENDVIKGFDAHSAYADGKWTGTLTELKPGEGYLYYSGKAISFYYPDLQASATQNARGNFVREQESKAPWQYNAHKYADNTAVIGKLFVNGSPVTDGSLIVGAFYDDECCGIGRGVDGLIFMTIHGSMAEKKVFKLKAYDKATGMVFDIAESILFTDKNIGTVCEPMEFHIGDPTRISAITAGFNISPRPLKNRLFIYGNVEQLKEIQIISASGQKMIGAKYDVDGIDVARLATGIYFVVLVAEDGTTYYEKVMKINN